MTMRCLVALAITLMLADPAAAAKWAGGCPKVKQKLSAIGKGPAGQVRGISRYYEHVGHEVTHYLKDKWVERYGGFSTEPGGNTVEMIFTPIDGDPIALPPFAVTATTPSTLTFTIPDSTPIIGRPLAGPATIRVKRGEQHLYDAFRQVILPPMNDVHALVQQGTAIEVLATMDRTGRVWVPLDFNGYGQGGEQLPECPTELTPVTPFAVDFSLKNGDDQALPYLNFGNLKKNAVFLGDYVVFGLNMYGNKLLAALDVTPATGKEFVVCAKNDALQLVIRFEPASAALSNNSLLIEQARDGSPLVVKIENVSLDPEVAEHLAAATYDSGHLPCYPVEP